MSNESKDSTDKKVTTNLSPENLPEKSPDEFASDEKKKPFVNFDTDSAEKTWASRTSLLKSRIEENLDLANSLDKTPINRDTAILPSSGNARWRRLVDQQNASGTASLGDQREVLFVIRGMIERVVMTDNSVVTLGRFDAGTQANKEIDLNPYGGMDRGVSRHHCKVQLQENHLYVIDLESTNGTFLAGTRLEPNTPTLLRKGDELTLGRLSVQVLFR